MKSVRPEPAALERLTPSGAFTGRDQTACPDTEAPRAAGGF